MANGTELATAYITLLADTSSIDKDVRKALSGAGKYGDTAGKDIGQRMSRAISGHASSAGRDAGSKFTSAFNKGVSNVGVTKWFSTLKTDATKSGNAAGFLAGKAMGAGITAGLTAATAGLAAVVGGIGVTLFKGFERYKSLDATAKRLGAMGKTVEQVRSIVADINDVVEGTPIALDAASKSATQFLQGGVKEGKDLKEVLTAIADASGASGTSFDDLAIIFGQVMNKGKLQAEEMLQLNERGIGIQAALRKEFGWTGDELEKLSKEGKISFQQLLQAVEGSFGGMAKKAGDSVEGAIGNMQTAVARTGANFLAAIFGDPLSTTEGPGGMAQAINNVTTKINELNNWVVGHQSEIKQFFIDAGEVARDLADRVKDVGNFLREHPGLIQGVVAAFAAWKAIEGVAALITSLKAISTLLKVTLPADAAVGGAAVGSNFTKGLGLAGFVLRGGVWILPAAIAYTIIFGDRDVNPQTQTSGGAGQPQLPGVNLPGGNGQLPGFSGPGQHPGPPQIGGGGNALPAGSGVERWRGTFSSVLDRLGLPQEPWLSRGLMQMQTESGGNPRAINNWDSNAAAGTPSMGLMQTIGPTFNAYVPPGFSRDPYDPEANIAAAIMYTLDQYGGPQGWQGHGYTKGGGVDSVPAMLTPGEHVLTTADVAALGGQDGVYAFRNALHRDDGGEIPWLPGERRKVPHLGPGNFNPLAQLDTSHATWRGEPGATGFLERTLPSHIPNLRPPSAAYLEGFKRGDVTFAQWATMVMGKNRGWLSHLDVKQKPPVMWPGFAEGGAVDQELLQQLLSQGVDPNTLIHGQGQGAAPGPTQELIDALAAPGMGSDVGSRTEGYIPAAAGSTGVAGTSFAASLLNLGNEAVAAAIDQAAGAGAMAANAFAPGAGAGVQLGANLAKRGVSYGFQMASIGVDALVEQLTPFGAPRWLGYDYTGFMPQLGQIPALTTSLEKAVGEQGQGQGTAPPMPPGTEHMLPGAQPGVPVPPGPPPGPPPGALPSSPGAPPPGLTPGAGTPPFGQPPTPSGNMSDPNYWKNMFGFDQGGWMQPGSYGVNLTNRPEPVFTNAQWSSIEKTALMPPDSSGQFGVRIENLYATDADDVKRKIDSQQRLAMMRYSGRP